MSRTLGSSLTTICPRKSSLTSTESEEREELAQRERLTPSSLTAMRSWQESLFESCARRTRSSPRSWSSSPDHPSEALPAGTEEEEEEGTEEDTEEDMAEEEEDTVAAASLPRVRTRSPAKPDFNKVY